MQNIAIKRAGAITTSDIGSTYLLPIEQANLFIEKVREAAATINFVRKETMMAPTKAINRIWVPRRVLRAGTENTAPTTQKPFSNDQVVLTASLMKAAYELTRQTKRDTLAKGQYEQQTVGLMTEHIGIDSNDLMWNGDTTDYSSASSTVDGAHTASVTTVSLADASSFPASSLGYGFVLLDGSERISYTAKSGNDLTGVTRGDDGTTAATYSGGESATFVQDALYPVFDGVLAQITSSGTVVDGATINSGDLDYDHFEALIDGQPARYRNNPRIRQSNRFFLNDKMRRRWRRVLTGRATMLGDASIYAEDKDSVHGIPFHVDEHLPDGVIVFGPLVGIIHGMRADSIQVARTSEGKDLVSRSATYYQWEIEADVQLDEGEMFGRCNSLTTTL